MTMKTKPDQTRVPDKREKKNFHSLRLTKPFSISVLILANLAISPQANADTFSCKELKTVVAEAENQFVSLKGELIKKETAIDLAKAQGVSVDALNMKFESKTYATKTPLSGANKCQIVESSSEDEDAKNEQISFDCQYEKITRLTKNLGQELSQCISGEVDAESDEDEFIIYANRVESGEGYNSTSIEAGANAIQGLKLSIRKSSCMNKKTGGCEL